MDKLIPTRYGGQIELGGSTKPWTIFAIMESDTTDPIELPYVVKLFSPSNVEQQPCIAKEFICNKLAREFDLFVPDSGIINLNNPEFLSTLKRSEINILKQRYNGNTYASELLVAALVSENIKDLSTNIEDRAMIYAFDCFILNIDRWGFHKKANLMLHKENFMLIDHELSLPFIDSNNRKTLETILVGIGKGRLIYPYESHLFYNSLKGFNGKKDNLFTTFHEYLTHLSDSAIQRLVDELTANNIDVGAIDLLFEYIREIKKIPSKFCNILLNTIS